MSRRQSVRRDWSRPELASAILHLSDGTKVVLGPLSSVKISSGYGSSNREVEIRGDAYFDVVHDGAKPFTVHIGNAAIQDVGTKFAVRSDGSGGIGVSVSEGSVSLAPLQSAAPAVVLKAGDQGRSIAAEKWSHIGSGN